MSGGPPAVGEVGACFFGCGGGGPLSCALKDFYVV